MAIPLSLFRVTANVLPAYIAHSVAADTCEFVATGRLDEARTATWTGAFDGCRAGGLDSGTERKEEGLVACVRIIPGFSTVEAGSSFAGRSLAAEAGCVVSKREVSERLVEHVFG
jgi:hypothetical protein